MDNEFIERECNGYAERDPVELADRYATFFNRLRARHGFEREDAMKLTSDLIFSEQQKPFMELPEIKGYGE